MNESLRPNEDHSHASVGTENVNLQVSGGLNFRLDQGFTFLVYFFAAVTVTILIVMTLVIFKEAQPAVLQFGFGFLWSQDWDTGNQLFGALPYIYGTLVSSAIAILLTVPVGISVALVTSEDFFALTN